MPEFVDVDLHHSPQKEDKGGQYDLRFEHRYQKFLQENNLPEDQEIVPPDIRQKLVLQLLGDPENEKQRGSIEDYVETRNQLVRDGRMTEIQAVVVNHLPEVQAYAVQLLLRELHPEKSSSHWDHFNPAFNYRVMKSRLEIAGIITNEEINEDPAIRSSAVIVMAAAAPERKEFLSAQLRGVGIELDVAANTHDQSSSELDDLLVDEPQVPYAIRNTLFSQLLGDEESRDPAVNILRYTQTRDALVSKGIVTTDQANHLPEVRAFTLQLLLMALHPEERSDFAHFNPAFNYWQMRGLLVDAGIITADEADSDPRIRDSVSLLISSARDDLRKKFLEEQFTKVGIDLQTQ
jgi:hypothetical protein